MTAAVAEAMKRHEQEVHGLADVPLPASAAADEVIEAAQQKQWEILTTDDSLVDALFAGGVRFARTVVYLQLEGGDVEQDDAVDRLFDRYRRLNARRLYTVTASRVKVRQLPGA